MINDKDYGEEKKESSRNIYWCPGPESNRHALRRGILSPLRLPVSPPGQSLNKKHNIIK
jgi:hypothetical protein